MVEMKLGWSSASESIKYLFNFMQYLRNTLNKNKMFYGTVFRYTEPIQPLLDNIVETN